MSPKEHSFDNLCDQVRCCAQCPRMSASERILGCSSGRLDSHLMFIGEAPGRMGADDSAMPFHGDKSGNNFEDLIEAVGLTRRQFFITNAVLCNPKDGNGNNATPSRSEISNCNTFLKKQIDLVDPKIVVTLGGKALEALKMVQSHDIGLGNGVGKTWNWYNRLLIPAYHPGQRAMIHRSFDKQLDDYRFIADNYVKVSCFGALGGDMTKFLMSPFELAEAIIERAGAISYFRLHKMFYLAEYLSVRKRGTRISNAYIVRQKDGPYVTDLQVQRIIRKNDSISVRKSAGNIVLSLDRQQRLFSSSLKQIAGASDIYDIIDDLVRRFEGRGEQKIKSAAYLTGPMRRILRQEKHVGKRLLNLPIEFETMHSDTIS